MNTRRIHLSLLLILATIFMVGCSSDDNPAAPGAGLELTELFTEDEAVITNNADDVNLRLVGVQFSTTTADLRAEAMPVLDKFREVFAHYDDVTYSVEGHTDSRGSSAYNQRLSEQRAQEVKRYFEEELGAAPENITAKGFGENVPIENNATANGRAANRRIEVIIQFND